FERVFAAKLGVEIGGVGWNICQDIINLVIDRHAIVIEVLEGDLAFLVEWHLPIGIERAARIDADGQRADLAIATPATGEEIAQRTLDRWLGFVIPINAQDLPARLVQRRGR